MEKENREDLASSIDTVIRFDKTAAADELQEVASDISQAGENKKAAMPHGSIRRPIS